ncbi:flagellin lysine-N-methylase [Paraburkholderia bonniea]|uniref:flagellin lysine-N-methylase n=1 Tax=Paraburkholderia bonniea TaxID=2152891 RepID=UPI001290C4A9|nr:flagellin lysine-N-methylase [Paraburkholderia bonniea]WJF90756.1 flagellin lysine-N-methylase [Paraburkholderia bonniea]WJF94070.1 flagellin lysine-N-methylase [Paraburkholderia bonniea]
MNKLLTKTMLVPRYQTRFTCVGPECPDTCCSGWRITIDKPTFQRYKATGHSTLKPLFKLHVKRNRQASGDAEYGVIKLDGPSGTCGMQAASGLCQVQSSLGEDALSNTCHAYPRHTRQFAGAFEQSLTLSCPQAARLALLEPDAFEFEQVPVTARDETVMAHPPVPGLDHDTMFAIRTWAMQLLHTRQLSVVERLAVLGLFCDQIEALLEQKQPERLPFLLEQMTLAVESGAILESLASLPSNEALHVELFARFLCNRNIAFRSVHQQNIFRQIAMGLGADEEGTASVAQIEARYRAGRELLVQSAGLEAVLERYLLNETIREAFPWGHGSPLFHYRHRLVCFGVVRMMLAGYANTQGHPLAEAEAAEVIQVFCRAFQHNGAFASSIENILHQCEWESLHQWIALLK